MIFDDFLCFLMIMFDDFKAKTKCNLFCYNVAKFAKFLANFDKKIANNLAIFREKLA